MTKSLLLVCLGALSILINSAFGKPVPAFSPDELVAAPTSSWPTNGGNIFNQRYSPLDQITTQNVEELKGVWRAHLNGSGVGPPFSGEGQPIVFDGVIYISTGADDVFALSVETGEILWEYKSNLDRAISTVCCGWTSRGVGLGDGKIFLGRLDGKLVALDPSSGEEIWNVQAEKWEEGYTITSAPLYYDGLVITGFAGAEYGTRGRIKAFDAGTGELIWTFYTIPAPGEYGHDTWPKNSDVWKNGGGTVWQTPAVDPELGLVYFSTGNPGPDFTGTLREGDNLFSVSMMAIDVKTGKYRWHFQQVHHDIWDYDSPAPVVLFDIDLDGKQRKAIAEVSKTGWVYILDRTTGEPLIGIEEKAVPQDARQLTSPTQPYPVGDAVVPQKMEMPVFGYPLINEGRIFTPFWKDAVLIKPSAFGGNNWPPSSYDPELGQLFVCASDSIGIFTGGVDDKGQSGQQYHGGEFGFSDIPRTGIFAAMDMRTNKIVWRQRWSDMCYSGSVATGGGLVFTGKNDGRFIAINSRTGKSLWEFQTGAGVNAPASVFEYKGDQYVVVYSAGNLFAQSPPGDSVWLFALNGELGEVSSQTVTDVGDVVLDGADMEAGAELYARVCAACHGAKGEGGHGGGPSLHRKMEPGYMVSIVTNGGTKMPGFGGVQLIGSPLTSDNIRDIVVHVLTQFQQVVMGE
jgi:quinohemoprotein ethanol dehydrogenase